MNFDLNVNNYSKDELREMFELPPNFDKNLFENKEMKLRETILKNDKITKETQINTINFLIKAKTILLNEEPKEPKESYPTPITKIVENVYNANYTLAPVNLVDSTEHMVQQRSNTPYLSSYPSQYFPGVINPIKKKTTTMNLNFDSKFRDNYYTTSSTNYNTVLPLLINNILSIGLSNIELPTTFYNISKQFGNNFFTVKLTDTGETTIINIPSGNYDQVGLINAINNQLFMLSGNLKNIIFIININNEKNGTGQTMVGCAPNTSFNFELIFQENRHGIEDRNTPLPLKLGWTLGFRNGNYIGNQNYVSESIMDISGPRYVFLVVDDYNNNFHNGFYSAFNSSLLNKNILARISIVSPTYNVLIQNNLNVLTTPREYFGPVNMQNLTIQLLDEYGRILDLNNMDYSFCLTITQAYDI
jgi:hypothetical protein